jgi:hypothetical protein
MKIRKKEISIKHCLFVLLALVGTSYFLFQARFMVLGPMLEITYPKNGALVASSVVNIEGRARNIAWISLNGRQIFTDENGRWSEKMIVSPGTSIMTVKTKDRFGREAEKSVEIFAN